MPRLDEIEYIDYPSNRKTWRDYDTYLREERPFVWANRKYPWLKWLLGAVVIISVLHFVIF